MKIIDRWFLDSIKIGKLDSRIAYQARLPFPGLDTYINTGNQPVQKRSYTIQGLRAFLGHMPWMPDPYYRWRKSEDAKRMVSE